MRISFLASAPQYADHLRPVFDALPEDARGVFTDDPTDMRGSDLAVVSAWGDMMDIATYDGETFTPHVPTVMFEHGIGFSFHGDGHTNGSYAGGIGRGKLTALPAPNDWAARRNLAAYPDIPSPVVGVPKMDELVRLPRPQNEKAVIAVSFHWHCTVCPETDWALPHFEPALQRLSRIQHSLGIRIIGHGHPRISNYWSVLYGSLGIEYVPHFEDVCRIADVYVNDSSSTLYEFAALDRPVIALNDPSYRRDVQHGLRFWDAVPGQQVDHPDDLVGAIMDNAMYDPYRDDRRFLMPYVFPYLGQSAARAAAFLMETA